jgi:RNA polymerase sigma-70 factor, ECF subfamily
MEVAARSPDDTASELYREHFEFVWRNARRFGADDAWVEDAVHETFLVATRRLHEFEGKSSLRTWLFAIAVRVVQRMQRDRSRYQTKLRRVEEQAPPDVDLPHDREDAARTLRALLLHLDEAKRVVLILAELEGMTTPEIARELGLKQGTVDSRLRNARLELARVVKRLRARDERRAR